MNSGDEEGEGTNDREVGDAGPEADKPASECGQAIQRNNRRKTPENEAVLKKKLNEFSAVAQSASKALTQTVNKQKETKVDDKDWDFCKHLYNKIKDIPEGDAKDDLQLEMQQLVQSARKNYLNPSPNIQRGRYQETYAVNDANVRQSGFQHGSYNSNVTNVRQSSVHQGMYGTDEMQCNEMQSNSYQGWSSASFDSQQPWAQSDNVNAFQSQAENLNPEVPNNFQDLLQSSPNQYTSL